MKKALQEVSMNNDLEQFSEERLKDIIELADNPTMVSLARIALSAKQAKPVAFTGSGSLSAIKVGHEGYIWGTSAEAHPIELYTTPQPAHTEQDGWIKCSERMPDDGESVLTSFRGGMRTAMCKVNNTFGHKMFVDEQTLFNGVPADYWMPLPDAPKPESE